MSRPLNKIEREIGLPDKARGNPIGRWDQTARTFGYANVGPLIADLCVAYDSGKIARAKGQACRQILFKGDHAKVWVDGWHGWKKPEA